MSVDAIVCLVLVVVPVVILMVVSWQRILKEDD